MRTAPGIRRRWSSTPMVMAAPATLEPGNSSPQKSRLEVRTRLSPGGRWIRTIGPRHERAGFCCGRRIAGPNGGSQKGVFLMRYRWFESISLQRRVRLSPGAAFEGREPRLSRGSPNAVPLCGKIAGIVSIGDVADRAPLAMDDGEVLSLGRHRVRWFATPHLPHAWECGFLSEETTKTLLCGDLFTQGGAEHPPLTEADILDPSEAFRREMDYYSHTKTAAAMIERLAATRPTTLACMHGAAWRGDGAQMLRALGERLERPLDSQSGK